MSKIVVSPVLVVGFKSEEPLPGEQALLGRVLLHQEDDSYMDVARKPIPGEQFRRDFIFLHPGQGVDAASRIEQVARLQLRIADDWLSTIEKCGISNGGPDACVRILHRAAETRRKAYAISRQAADALELNQKEADPSGDL